MFELPRLLHKPLIVANARISLGQLLTDCKYLFIHVDHKTFNGYYQATFGTLIYLLTQSPQNLLLQHVQAINVHV